MAVNANQTSAVPPVLRVVGAKNRPNEQAIGRARQARWRLESGSSAAAPSSRDRFAHLRRSYD